MPDFGNEVVSTLEYDRHDSNTMSDGRLVGRVVLIPAARFEVVDREAPIPFHVRDFHKKGRASCYYIESPCLRTLATPFSWRMRWDAADLPRYEHQEDVPREPWTLQQLARRPNRDPASVERARGQRRPQIFLSDDEPSSSSESDAPDDEHKASLNSASHDHQAWRAARACGAEAPLTCDDILGLLRVAAPHFPMARRHLKRRKGHRCAASANGGSNRSNQDREARAVTLGAVRPRAAPDAGLVLSIATREHRALTIALCAFANEAISRGQRRGGGHTAGTEHRDRRARSDDECGGVAVSVARFTTIQINLNCEMCMHRDGQNVGPSLAIALGDLGGDGGGAVWIDGRGDIDAHSRWVEYDGTTPHCTRPWSGPERWMIVFFTHRGARMALGGRSPPRLKRELLRHGFSLPSTILEARALAGGIATATSDEEDGQSASDSDDVDDHMAVAARRAARAGRPRGHGGQRAARAREMAAKARLKHDARVARAAALAATAPADAPEWCRALSSGARVQWRSTGDVGTFSHWKENGLMAVQFKKQERHTHLRLMELASSELSGRKRRKRSADAAHVAAPAATSAAGDGAVTVAVARPRRVPPPAKQAEMKANRPPLVAAKSAASSSMAGARPCAKGKGKALRAALPK